MADKIPDAASSPIGTSPDGDSPPTPGPATGQQHTAYPPGTTVYDPTSAPSADLNPRSCVVCRRRKVRCDKRMPCANCRRAQIACIFPAPERAPRRPRRKDPNALKQQSSERELELVKRLRKLEGIVEELSGQIELETTRHQPGSGDSPEATAAHGIDILMAGGGITTAERPESLSGRSTVSSNSPVPPNARIGAGAGRPVSSLNSSLVPLAQDPKDPKGDKDMHARFGRLVLNDKGRSRYVSSAFWSKINDEV